jgi:hypothetical protein
VTGRGTFGYLIAQLAIETGIAPQHLLDLDSTMLENMLKVFDDRAKEAKSARAGKGRG